MIKLNGTVITPTIFPDKTSQVWKLPEGLLVTLFDRIEWHFESEQEIVHLLQLTELCNEQRHIYISYLPYARQDKPVSNSSTFALTTLIKMLQVGSFTSITVLDPHNEKALPSDWIIDRPDKRIQTIVDAFHLQVCYPDKGAAARYKLISDEVIIADKIRNQLTGEIEGVELDTKYVSRTILIVDDICDGGRTFTEVAKLLYAGGASQVFLYVTHGIFSKGIEVLKDAGINRIFTYKGEIE